MLIFIRLDVTLQKKIAPETSSCDIMMATYSRTELRLRALTLFLPTEFVQAMSANGQFMQLCDFFTIMLLMQFFSTDLRPSTLQTGVQTVFIAAVTCSCKVSLVTRIFYSV